MGTAGGWRLQLSHSWLTWRSSDTPTGARTHASAHKHTLGSSGSWWRLIWEVKPFTHCLQRQNIQHLPPRLPVELFFLALSSPFLDLSSFVTLLAWDALFFPFSSYLDYMRAHGGSCCINLASRKMETPVNPTKQPCSQSNCISAEVVTYTLFSLRGVCDAVVLAVSQTERGKAVY